MITIVQGLGGVLHFQNFTPLAPALVTENLSHFWDIVPPAQIETLASAYQHLSQVEDANGQLLESVGQMLQRIEARADRTPADNFILSRLIGEWGRLKEPNQEASPTPPPTKKTSTPQMMRAVDASSHFYTDGEGGYFPHSWVHLSRELKSAFKQLAFSRQGKMSELTTNEEAHALFLADALAAWVGDMKTSLLETGAKGAGQSGLVSAPSIRASLGLIADLLKFLKDLGASEPSLAALVWRSYGANADLRMAINRLSTMRMALSVLEEAERNALDESLYALDAAYLTFLLSSLPGRADESVSDAGGRDESFGEKLATILGDEIVALPLSDRTVLRETDQARLTSAGTVLRLLAGELRADAPSPVVRGFLKKLLPSEMLRLAQVVGMIQDS